MPSQLSQLSSLTMGASRSRKRSRRRSRRRKSAIIAREGLGSSRYNLNRYCYNESDSLDVGTLEQRKICEGIDLGNAYGERDGTRIYLDFLNFKMSMVNPNVAETDCGWLRVLVLHNKFPGTTYSTNMFNSESETRTPIDYSNAGNEFQILKSINTHKYNVYFDRRYQVKTQLGGVDNPHTLLINVNIPIRRVFSFETDAVADNAIIPDMDILFFIEKQDGGAAFTSSMLYQYQLIHYFRSLD